VWPEGNRRNRNVITRPLVAPALGLLLGRPVFASAPVPRVDQVPDERPGRRSPTAGGPIRNGRRPCPPTRSPHRAEGRPLPPWLGRARRALLVCPLQWSSVTAGNRASTGRAVLEHELLALGGIHRVEQRSPEPFDKIGDEEDLRAGALDDDVIPGRVGGEAKLVAGRGPVPRIRIRDADGGRLRQADPSPALGQGGRRRGWSPRTH
jgi:hypothetical protein